MESTPNDKAGTNSPVASCIANKLIELRDTLSMVSLLLKDLQSNLDLIERGEATAISQALMRRLMNRENPDGHDKHGLAHGSAGET
jgi:hypothetical protein